MMRAAFTNLRQGRVAQGGSTLTQQLAKNLFLSSERTWARKLEELVLALWLEVRLGKRDILELYLNRVYFGAGAYGIEAAARRFFAKSARDADAGRSRAARGPAEGAVEVFAGLQSARRARARPQRAGQDGGGRLLSAEEGEKAARAAPRFAERSQRGQSGVDYAVDAVLERLPSLVGRDRRARSSSRRPSTAALQRRAQALVHAALTNDGTQAPTPSQAGLVLIDMDGAIRALVGGRSYAESQFNRALKARRQPGSAFKTFVYLAALESGLTPDSTVLDLPILGSGWSPRNEGGGYRGAVTLRDALAQSMNAAAARLNMTVGPRKTAARGAPSRHPLGAARGRLPGARHLGGDAARAHRRLRRARQRRQGARAAHRQPRAHGLRPACCSSGGQEPAKVLVAPAHVAAMNDMLSAGWCRAPASAPRCRGHPAAGKTGTSQDFRDAWFVGYTAHFVAGVWVGNDDGRAMNNVMGGSLPARLWRDVMLIAHDGDAVRCRHRRSIASLAAARASSSQPDERANVRAADAARADRSRLHRARDHRGVDGCTAAGPAAVDRLPALDGAYGQGTCCASLGFPVKRGERKRATPA